MITSAHIPSSVAFSGRRAGMLKAATVGVAMSLLGACAQPPQPLPPHIAQHIPARSTSPAYTPETRYVLDEVPHSAQNSETSQHDLITRRYIAWNEDKQRFVYRADTYYLGFDFYETIVEEPQKPSPENSLMFNTETEIPDGMAFPGVRVDQKNKQLVIAGGEIIPGPKK